MRSTGTTQTVKIATARLEFSSRRRLTQALHVVAVAALVCLVVMVGRHLYRDAALTQALVDDLTRQNETLRTELARTRTELELERSTRAALARQVAEMNAETSELQSRLAFFSSQSGQARGGRGAR
jgi:septal ring factor EnvC (AmiA/AmiB activator)